MKKRIIFLIIVLIGFNINRLAKPEEEYDKLTGNYTLKEEKADEKGFFLKYKKINSDVICVLSVPGTDICYPVMYNEDDPEMYLNRDIDGEDSIYGTPFIVQRDIWEDDLVYIYGHFFKSGEMFGFIHNYQDEEYLPEHQYIVIEDGETRREYKVFAVCEMDTQDNNGFVYNDRKYNKFDTESKYNELLQHILENNNMDCKILPEYKDKIVSLSTCKNYSKYSTKRLVLYAVYSANNMDN